MQWSIIVQEEIYILSGLIGSVYLGALFYTDFPAYRINYVAFVLDSFLSKRFVQYNLILSAN